MTMAQLPVKMRKIIGVDRDWRQAGYDLSNAELRIVAELSGDEMFLSAFALGWDLHTLNACELFGMDYPPSRIKDDIHTGEACEAWRIQYSWEGEDDARRKFGKIFNFRCVTMDTQALTREGWKTYDQLVVGEDILTYNAGLGLKEWQPLLEKVYYPNAPVVRMYHGHGFSVKSTPNHRWFTRNRKWDSINNRWHTRPYMTEGVQTTDEISQESNIIANAPMGYDPGTGYSEYPIQKYGYDWTKAVCQMSSEQRQAFLHGFMLADGCVNTVKGTSTWTWAQNEGNIAEALIAASVLETSGYVYIAKDSKGKMIRARLSKRGHITGQKLQKEQLDDQAVWCPRTANESWVMRQGYTVTITGNTLYGGSPKTAYQIPGAGKLGLSRSELEQSGYRWLAAHPKLNEFWEHHGLEAMQRFCTRNAYGRRRILCSADEMSRWREGINHPVQSFVSDLVNRIVVETYAACNGISFDENGNWAIPANFETKVRLCGQMHDSLLWAFPEERFTDMMNTALAIAQKPVKLGEFTFQFPVSSYTKEFEEQLAEAASLRG